MPIWLVCFFCVLSRTTKQIAFSKVYKVPQRSAHGVRKRAQRLLSWHWQIAKLQFGSSVKKGFPNSEVLYLWDILGKSGGEISKNEWQRCSGWTLNNIECFWGCGVGWFPNKIWHRFCHKMARHGPKYVLDSLAWTCSAPAFRKLRSMVYGDKKRGRVLSCVCSVPICVFYSVQENRPGRATHFFW
jgi:hypothetical protein